MNGDGWAVMGEGLSDEEKDLIEAVTHNCPCPAPASAEEAETWRHHCAASALLNEATLARLSALRREAETREWGERT